MIAKGGCERTFAMLMIVNIIIHVLVTQSQGTERRGIYAISELRPVSLAQTDGCRQVSRKFALECGACIDEHGSNFFRVESHTDIDATLVLLVERIVQVVCPVIVLKKVVTDVRIRSIS